MKPMNIRRQRFPMLPKRIFIWGWLPPFAALFLTCAACLGATTWRLDLSGPVLSNGESGERLSLARVGEPGFLDGPNPCLRLDPTATAQEGLCAARLPWDLGDGWRLTIRFRARAQVNPYPRLVEWAGVASLIGSPSNDTLMLTLHGEGKRLDLRLAAPHGDGAWHECVAEYSPADNRVRLYLDGRSASKEAHPALPRYGDSRSSLHLGCLTGKAEGNRGFAGDLASFALSPPGPSFAMPVPVCTVEPCPENRQGLNLFTPGEKIVMRLRLRDTPGGPLHCRWAVRDFWGDLLEEGESEGTRDSTGILFQFIPRVERSGWFRLNTAFRAGGAPLSVRYEVTESNASGLFKGMQPADRNPFFAFAKVETPRAEPDGLANLHSGIAAYGRRDLTRLIDALRLSGAAWARETSDWPGMEPQPGVWNPSSAGADGAVRAWAETYKAIASIGVKLTVFWQATPAWALTEGKPVSAALPADLAAVPRSVKLFLSNAGPVGTWECWNETDLRHFSKATPDQYASFLKAARSALPGVGEGGGVRLAISGFARDVRRGYIDLLLDNGAASCFDLYNFHTYAPLAGGRFEASIDAHLALLARRGLEQMPVWITETGAPYARGRVAPFDEAATAQVDYLLRGATTAYARGVDEVFYFLLRPWFNRDGTAQFGLLRKDLTPYPVYAALAIYNSLLGGGRHSGSLKRAGLGMHEFTTPRGRVAVAWGEGENSALTLPVRGRPRVLDAMGQPVALEGVDGAWRVALRRSLPVYVLDAAWLEALAPAAARRGRVTVADGRMDRHVILRIACDEAALFDDSSIIAPNYDGLASGWAPLGYGLPEKGELSVGLEIWNLSEVEKRVGVYAQPHPSLNVKLPIEEHRVPPRGKVLLPLRVGRQALQAHGACDVRIEGRAEGKTISPLVFRLFPRP
jgi:hypothetical protein